EVAVELAHLLLGVLLELAPPSPDGEPDAVLGALGLVVAPAQFRGVGRRFPPPGVVDALVGSGDRADQQRAEALHEGVEELARRAVEGEGTPPLERVPGEDGPGLEPPA